MAKMFCSVEAETNRHLDAQDAASRNLELTSMGLFYECLHALLQEPARMLRAPGIDPKRKLPAVEIFTDEIDEDMGRQLLVVLAACDRGDHQTARLMSQAIIVRVSKKYADDYADELAHS